MSAEELQRQSKQWTASAKKILDLAAPKLAPLGFRRTRPTFFVREREHWLEFIHAHKLSGNRYFRLHVGLRLLNTPSERVVLNGPTVEASDERFFLWFVNSPESWERCAGELEKVARFVALPWLDEIGSLDGLLGDRSPLDAAEKVALREAVRGDAVAERVARSRQELGLRLSKTR
jgi:hypothetical protein